MGEKKKKKKNRRYLDDEKPVTCRVGIVQKVHEYLERGAERDGER